MYQLFCLLRMGKGITGRALAGSQRHWIPRAVSSEPHSHDTFGQPRPVQNLLSRDDHRAVKMGVSIERNNHLARNWSAS